MNSITLFSRFQKKMIPKVDQVMFRYFLELMPSEFQGQKDIIQYHFQWDQPDDIQKKGKRLRPLMLLLSATSLAGTVEKAMPAAAAVEFVHNFSLIHDDIEDHDLIRHGIETVWKKFGVEKAINAGDALFTLAFISLSQVEGMDDRFSELLRILSTTCAKLTGGQDMDLEFELGGEISMDQYLTMVCGKTASLFEGCCRMGALLGEGTEREQTDLANFGKRLGIAFQIRDDWLGLWGDPEKTGKTAGNDLVSGKRTFPILYALGKDPSIKIKISGEKTESASPELIQRIASTGAGEYTIQYMNHLLDEAMSELQKMDMNNISVRTFNSLVEDIRIK